MSLDCEFNQPSRKTIEIGAAIYDVRSGDLIAKFKTFVDPGEPVNPEITELTRITNEDVQGAPTISEAFQKLKEFHAKWEPFMNPLVWGSGKSNDSLALYEESGTVEANFMGFRVIDAKTLYQSLRIFSGKKIKGGLSEACSAKGLGIGWDEAYGKNHGALADAHNTFRVWYHMIRKFEEGYKAYEKERTIIDQREAAKKARTEKSRQGPKGNRIGTSGHEGSGNASNSG